MKRKLLKFPHPVLIFIYLSVIIIMLSSILSFFNYSISYQKFDRSLGKIVREQVFVKSLLNFEGIEFIFNSMVSNFTGFTPLGTVLVSLLGVGICEQTGFIEKSLEKIISFSSKRMITAIIVLSGIISSIASDTGYLVIIPLGGIIFQHFKRSPIAGILCAFAGVSGGFSANLFIGTLDPQLAGAATEAAKLINPNYLVTPLASYYFMFISTILLTILGVLVTEKIIEPKVSKYKIENFILEKGVILDEEKTLQTKGLRLAYFLLCIFIIFILIFFFYNHYLLHRTFQIKQWYSKGIIAIIMLFFLIPGITYGIVIKKIRKSLDVVQMLIKSFEKMSSYIVLIFFMSQFVAYMNYTNLSTYMAVLGINLFKAIHLSKISLIIAFVIVTAIINLFMTAAFSKWAIIAPIFIPIFMELDLSPELVLTAYRIGDSVTNIITPTLSFLPMILVYIKEYNSEIDMGDVISLMFYYAIVFFTAWTLLLVVFVIFNLPLGPGSYISL